MYSKNYKSSGSKQNGSFSQASYKQAPIQLQEQLTNSSKLSILTIYVVLKAPEDFNLLNIIIESSDDRREKLDRFKVLKTYGKYHLFLYEISLDAFTKSFDFRLQVINSKRQEVSEAKTRSFDLTSESERHEQFIFSFSFPKQVKNLPIQGLNSKIESAFVYTYLLCATGRDRQSIYNFLNEISSLNSQEIENELETLLAIAQIGDLIKSFQEIWFALHGKLFSWSDVLKVKDKDFAIYAKNIPRFDKKINEISEILLFEKDPNKSKLILSGIQTAIIMDLNFSKNSALYELFLDKYPLAVEFFIDAFAYVPNHFGRTDIQNKIIAVIDKAEISQEAKLHLILKLRTWDNNTLTMNIVQKFYRNLKTDDFEKEIAEILSETKLPEKDIEKLKEALKLYRNHDNLNFLANTLTDLQRVLKLDEKTLTQAIDFSKIAQSLITEQSAEKFLAQSYIKFAMEFTEQLVQNGIDNISKEHLINKILYEISLATELWEFLVNVKEDDFEELKDFINDQNESYIDTKTIIYLEQVWRFKKSVFDKSPSLLDFITKCKEILSIENKEAQEYHEIDLAIRESDNAKNSIKRTMADMKNKDAFFKFRINQVISMSTITVMKTDTLRKVMAVVYNPAQAKEKDVYFLPNLEEFKEKALLIINESSGEKIKSANDLTVLQQFVDLVNAIGVILECYNELELHGYTQNFIDSNKTEIKFEMPQDLGNLLDYQKLLRKYTEDWKNHLNTLYSTSYAFSHFYGKHLKDLHSAIINDQGKSDYFQNLILWTNFDFQDFFQLVAKKAADGEINKVVKLDLFKQVSFIRDLLEEASPEIWKYRTGHFEMVQPRVKLVNLPKENTFFGLVQSVTENEIHQLKPSHVLFCRPKTNPLEISSFLYRAFLNNQGLPFFIIGFEYLSAQLQNHFCDVLEHLLKILRAWRKNVNLILIGSKTTEKIYIYFYYHKEFNKKFVNHVENEKDCTNMLIKMVQGFSIFTSQAPGLGKTYSILKRCKDQKLKPCFFPIAGDITDENIAKRFSSVKIEENTALVIQLHNVVNKKLLDEILFQLIFFRSLKTNSFLFFPQHNFQLAIELQNLLDENYLESLRVLSTFKYSEFLFSIQEATSENVCIDNEKDLKFHFVMKYMKALNDGKIADTEISLSAFKKSFENNEPDSRTDEALCKILLGKYFFAPFSKNYPSYRQLRYFIEIFFSALKTFADSPYLSKASIHSSYDAVSERTKEQLTFILRSYFVKILLENSREFLVRTVSSESFIDKKSNKSNSKNFGEQLKDFPLLIMRQGESDDDFSYSLIYNDVDKVPKQLKMYFIVQTRPGAGENNIQQWMMNENKLNREFEKDDVTKKNSDELLEILKSIAGVKSIKKNPDYAITVDNFYKMCLIVQRIRSKIPIVIMGETGVGKTALIRFLAENVYGDELEVINVHAGVNFQALVEKMNKVKEKAALLLDKQRLWVFFDEFNTSEEVGFISEIILHSTFLGEPIEGNIVFVGACNPFRKKETKKINNNIGIAKTHREQDNGLLYKVLPSPESLLEVMWDYQDLKEAETLKYLETILKINYRTDKVVRTIDLTHQFFRDKIEKSAVSLRDVSRFKILYHWFLDYMPSQMVVKPSVERLKSNNIDNYQIPRNERAFILTLCFCYYLKLSTMPLRRDYIEMIEDAMGYKKGYILKVLENEQMDYLMRMELPTGIALNLALRENVFAALVCLMNKIPIIIVGVPGCSKSLAMRLLCANLRGHNSHEEFFRNLMELSVFHFQGSESCTSEDVEKLFERAKRSFNLKDVMPTILFDEIGLAELSVHNPLKVLHSHLEVGKTDVSFIGISNWELDAAKMGRFLVLARPLPDETELKTTAIEIFESILGTQAENFKNLVNALSASYCQFITNWKKSCIEYPDFFGLRDFYSLIKFVSNQIKKRNMSPKDHQEISKILRKAVEKDFDGQPDSVELFLHEVSKQLPLVDFSKEPEMEIMSIIQESLQDPDSRCLLIIIRGEALIHMASRNIKIGDRQIIMICGSNFQQDNLNNEEYNIRVMNDFVNHIENGNIIACKDLNNSIQTSLYDLYNKSYHKIGGKDYCRISIGAHSNFRCTVHPNFNCIVYMNESELGQVDPPFLNRFEKHYLTLDRFRSGDELSILGSLQEWIEKITEKYFESNPPLKKENLFANSSDEALASLCIKTFYNLKSNEITQDELLDQSLELCKKELLQNATSDFILWVNTSQLKNQERDEYDFIHEHYKAKHQILSQDISKAIDLKLIIFTYEQNLNVNPWSSEKTKLLKMVEMKCEKDLKLEIAVYFESSQDLLVIKMDYETEIKHLSLLLSLIDTFQKISSKTSKNFIIVLHYSRVAAVRSGETPLKEISYLNGWKQVFVENLSEIRCQIEDLPLKLGDLIDRDRLNIKEIITHSFQNCLQRFNFKFKSDVDDIKYLPSFMRFLFDIDDSKVFIALADKFVDKLIRKNQFKDWRKEILNHNQIANLALSTREAILLFVSERVEDLLTILIKRLFEEEAFASIFPDSALKLLEKCTPNVNDYLRSKVKKLEHTFEFHEDLLHNSLSTSLEQLTRAINSIEIVLNHPRLFPISKKDEDCIFIPEKDKSSVSLYAIALQLKEVEQSALAKIMSQEKSQNHQNIEENQNTEDKIDDGFDESEANYESLIKVFMQTFVEKTRLTRFDLEGRCVMNILEKLNTEKYVVEKELYLLDIRNIFLEKVIKTDIGNSNFLDRLIMLFLEPNYPVEDYLMVLLRGEPLWRNLLQIYQIMDSSVEHKSFIEKLFFPDLDLAVKKRMGDMLNSQIMYLKSFFESCDMFLSPKETNIKVFGESKNYSKVFINAYLGLINLQTEFGKFGIHVSSMLTIWKNLIQLIESIVSGPIDPIYHKLTKILDKNQQENIFSWIDDFLEDFKKEEPKQNQKKITNFQAAVLYRFWMLNRSEDYVHRLLQRINSSDDFSNFCSPLLSSIIPLEIPSNINKIYKHLETLDDITKEFDVSIKSSDHCNYLSVIITDYFEKILVSPEIGILNENESKASRYLYKNFEDFRNYYEKLEKSQNSNSIQVLAIIAFFKHYLRHYAECLYERKNYKVLKVMETILSRNSSLADGLCVFVLKLLRMKQGSFIRLRKFLFEIENVKFIEKFKEELEEIPGKTFFIPGFPEPDSQRKKIQDKWEEFRERDFNDEKIFEELVDRASEYPHSRYQFLNILLTDIYAGIITGEKVENLKQLWQQKRHQLTHRFTVQQLKLIQCYLNRRLDNDFLCITLELTSDKLTTQILVLNTVNWLVCLNQLNSAWTSLFFKDGKVPEKFDEHFNKQFVLTDVENPYVANALRVLDNFKYYGIYICSKECDYIYTIGDCGWPNYTFSCPFCKEDVGNLSGAPLHTIAREAKGARRLGPHIPNRWDYNFYVCYMSMREDFDYWQNLENNIKEEIDRMRAKTVIKMLEGDETKSKTVEVRMVGYNRYTPVKEGKLEMSTLDRLKRMTDLFLRFSLHSALYVFSTLGWVSKEVMLGAIKAIDFNHLLNYLKENIEAYLDEMQKELDCNDSIIWIIALQQMFPSVVERMSGDDQMISGHERDLFEQEVEFFIYNNLGDEKMPTIKKYKEVSKMALQKLDSILCEERETSVYKYLRLLRMNKMPSLNDMMTFHDKLIKAKYPLLDECMRNLDEIKAVSKLSHIVQFSNEIMRLADYQITRDDAKTMKISEFIEKLPENRQEIMNRLLDNFLESWNSLNLGPIQYQCKILGTMTKYSKDSTVIAFLVDSLDVNNVYGKILSGVIYTLSDKQNAILNQISNRANQANELKNIQFFDNNTYNPQNATSEDILNITQEAIDDIIAKTSSSNTVYGNGVPVYDLERIQSELIVKVIGKKMFLSDLNLYQNVRFINETFSKKGKFSDYISQIRKLGLNAPIPDPAQLEIKFKAIQDKSLHQFYSTLKALLGSLEKLMTFYKNLAETNIKLADYVKKYKFTGISPLITQEAPIKDYDISCIVALYEWAERMVLPNIWTLLPNIYKSNKLDEEEKMAVSSCLSKMKENRTDDDTERLPDIKEFATALSRFACRCLMLGDFEGDSYLTDWLYVREDFWEYPYKENEIELLAMQFPRITFDKIFELYQMTEVIINPPKELPNSKPEIKEVIPKITES